MSVFKKFKNKGLAAFMALMAFVYSGVASAQITLPDTGVDVPGHITALVTALGLIAAAAIAAWAAFFAVRRGLSWVRRVG